MKIDSNVRTELQEAYQEWAKNKDQVKSINHENTQLLKEAAGKLNVKKNQVSAAFRFAKKAEEEGADELDSIVDIFETMKG